MYSQPPTEAKHLLPRQGLPEALANSLRERILNGEFQGGAALNQEAIAAQYGCSRMPVREAIRQLEAEGLIASKLHKGAVVTALSAEEILELFHLRAILECDILAYAIPNWSDENSKQCSSVLLLLEQAYRDKDMKLWGELNWEFHKNLYLPAARPQTMGVVQSINLKADRYIRLHLVLTDVLPLAVEEHRKILRLCESRQVKLAVNLLRKHILNAGTQLQSVIKDLKDLKDLKDRHQNRID